MIKKFQSGASSTSRRRIFLVCACLITIWATWKVSSEPDTSSSVVKSMPVVRSQNLRSLNPSPHQNFELKWDARSGESTPVSDIFNPPSIPSVVSYKPMGAPMGTPMEPAPVFKLKYVGRFEGQDNQKIFMADDKDQVLTVALGQNLADGWQLTDLSPELIVFRHLITGQEHKLPIRTSP